MNGSLTELIRITRAGCTLPQKPQGTAASSGSGDQKEGVSGRPLNAPQESQKGTALTAEQKKVSARLKALFPAYVNSLGLKDADGNPLTLDQKGNGSFKEYIEKTYMEGAQKALDAGTDLSRIDWLKIRDGKVVSMDLAKYAVYATRLKPAPAFDRLDGSSGENDEFGTETNQPRHFSTFGFQNRTDKNPMAPAEAIRMLSPLEYIGKAPVTLADPPWGSGSGYCSSCTGNPGSEAAGGRQGRGFCHGMGKRPCRGL